MPDRQPPQTGSPDGQASAAAAYYADLCWLDQVADIYKADFAQKEQADRAPHAAPQPAEAPLARRAPVQGIPHADRAARPVAAALPERETSQSLPAAPPVEEGQVRRAANSTLMAVGALVFLVLAFAGLASWAVGPQPTSTATATLTSTATTIPTATAEATATPLPPATATGVPTATWTARPLPTTTPLPPATATPTLPVPPPAPAAACPLPNAQVTYPGVGNSLSGVVAFKGSANLPDFQYYRFEYRPYGEETWRFLYRAEQPVMEGTLMEWHTSTVPRGDYELRLTVVSRSGNYPEPCVIRVRVY